MVLRQLIVLHEQGLGVTNKPGLVPACCHRGLLEDDLQSNESLELGSKEQNESH